MSVTSAHPMIKDATAASSDPQGPGHVSSDSEDEVFASSDPKAWAPTPPTPGRGLRLIRPYGESSALSDLRGSDFVSPGPQGGISASPVPWGSDLLSDKNSGPRVGPEPLQPLWSGGASLGARLGRVLM